MFCSPLMLSTDAIGASAGNGRVSALMRGESCGGGAYCVGVVSATSVH
jgi:cation transport regulator ChaC